MALVRQDKVQIEVEINGKKVKNTITDLNKAYRQTNKELNQLTPGTKEWVNKSKELGKIEKRLDDIRKMKRKIISNQKQVGGLFGRIGNIAKSALGRIPVLLAGIGLGKIIQGLFQTSVALDTFSLKSKTVFGDALDDVEEFAKKNATSLGLTRSQYVATATAAGDLLIPMGFQRETAAKLSGDLVNLSGALAEWTGGQKNSKEVSEILTKALLGEREQLKTLGIAIQEADVQQRLLQKNQKSLTGQALQQAKAIATLELIYEKSADAQAAFQNNTGNLARQMAQLKAIFNESSEAVSRRLIPVFSAILGTVVDLTGAVDSQAVSLSKEQFELNSLVRQLNDANNSEEERSQIIAKIQRQYPGFLDNIDTENLNYEVLRQRLEQVNEQFVLRIILAEKEAELQKQAERQARASETRSRGKTALSDALVQAEKEFEFLQKLRDDSLSNEEQAQVYIDALKDLETAGQRTVNKVGDDLIKQVTGIDAGLTKLIRSENRAIARLEGALGTITRSAENYKEAQDEASKILDAAAEQEAALNDLREESGFIIGNNTTQIDANTEAQNKNLETIGTIKKRIDELNREREGLAIGSPELAAVDAEIARLKARLSQVNRTVKTSRETRFKEAQKIAQLQVKLERETEKLRIELMEDGAAKRIALLKLEADTRIAELQKTQGVSAEAVAEQQILIEQQLQRDIDQVRIEATDQQIQRVREQAQRQVALLQGSAEEVSIQRIQIEQRTTDQVNNLIRTREELQIAEFRRATQAEIAALDQGAADVEQQRIDIEARREERIRIIREESSQRQQIEERRLAEERISSKEAAFQVELEQLESFYRQQEVLRATQELAANVSGGQSREVAEEIFRQKLIDIEERFLQQKLDLQQLYGQSSIDTQQAIEDLKLEQTRSRIDQEVSLELDKVNRIQESAQAVGDIAASVSQISQAGLQREIALIEEKKARAIQAAGENSRKRQAIETRYEKQITEVKRQAAKEQQGFSVSQALIDGALAVQRIAADVPKGDFGIATALLIAAQIARTAAQVAVIKSQAFAKGGPTASVAIGAQGAFFGGQQLQQTGSIAPGGNVKAPSLAVIGEKGPEWVAPNWMIRHPVYGQQIAQMERIRVRGFQEGGATITQPADDTVQAARSTPGLEVLSREFASLQAAILQTKFVTMVDDKEADLIKGKIEDLDNRRQVGGLS